MSPVEKLINLAFENDVEEQMDSDQVQALISLIEDGTVSSIEELSEYMDIKNQKEC
jgi:hypothetical protein